MALTRRAIVLGSVLAGAGAGACARAVSTDTEQGATRSMWERFAASHVEPSGRVVDNGNGRISHSEGQGVALLAAATAGDARTFSRLLTWTLDNLQTSEGLLGWRWETGKGLTDRNNASDGDLYFLWALSRGADKFNSKEYRQLAKAHAAALRNLCFAHAPEGRVLLPGRVGFVSAQPDGSHRIALNPSYFVFPAFKAARTVDSFRAWREMEETSEGILTRSNVQPTGLAPDWIELGDPILPWRERPAVSGYEAIRVPLFLMWSGKLRHPRLQAFATLARSGLAPVMPLDGSAPSKAPLPTGFEAVARLARSVVFKTVEPRGSKLDGNYYSDSLSLLAQMAMHDLVIGLE